jgi:DNA-binding transcriptional regulator of glucitol operon
VHRFLTPRWLLRHAIALVLVAACLALGWWQIGRARGGNALSYGYAIEWPVFALFVIFVWSREVRAELRGGYTEPEPAPTVPEDLRIEVPRRPAAAPEDDPDVGAYNEYLAWLAAHPRAGPGDYRPQS